MRWLPVLALALVGCGDDDGFSPTVENVAGSYSAAEFTLTTAAGTVDLIGLGNGEDVEADLAGTWTLAGSTVTFSQTADTFIRDVEFTAGPNSLTGEGTFEGQTVRLVLTKSA